MKKGEKLSEDYAEEEDEHVHEVVGHLLDFLIDGERMCVLDLQKRSF